MAASPDKSADLESRRTNPHVRGSCQVTLPRTVSGPGLTRLLPALSASPALSIVRCSGLLPPALHGSTTRTRGDGVSDPCVLSACCVFQGRLLQQVYLLLHLGTSRKPGAASRESGPCKGKPILGVTVTVSIVIYGGTSVPSFVYLCRNPFLVLVSSADTTQHGGHKAREDSHQERKDPGRTAAGDVHAPISSRWSSLA